MGSIKDRNSRDRRRQWHPTPVLLPGKSHGQRSLVVHGVAKSWIRLSDFTFTFTFPFHPLEKETATHSSVLAWRIPGTGEPVGLPSLGSHRVGHDLSDLAVTEAEDIKKRWQEYTEELYKKDLHDQDNHDDVITHTHLEPDILECEVKWVLGSINYEQS